MKNEETQIHRFVQFGALLYTKAWTQDPLAAKAPGQDLSLWIDLGKYESADCEISTAAKKVLENHYSGTFQLRLYVWHCSQTNFM